MTKEQRADYYRRYRANPDKKQIIKNIKDKHYYRKTIKEFIKEHNMVLNNFDINSVSIVDLKHKLRDLRNLVKSKN